MFWRKTDDEELYWSYLVPTVMDIAEHISPIGVERLTQDSSTKQTRRDVYEYVRSPVSGSLGPVSFLERQALMQNEASQAYFQYTAEAGAAFLAKATAQAAIGWHLGIYPTFWAGLAIEASVDLVLGPLVITAIDPKDKWSGGLDETRAYQEIAPHVQSGWSEGWGRSPANPDNWTGISARIGGWFT